MSRYAIKRSTLLLTSCVSAGGLFDEMLLASIDEAFQSWLFSNRVWKFDVGGNSLKQVAISVTTVVCSREVWDGFASGVVAMRFSKVLIMLV